MRYWVYINDKVEGPFEEDKLVTLNGFTPDTLLCAEDAASGGNQEWVKASAIFEFDQVPAAQPAAQTAPVQTETVQPAQTAAPVQEDNSLAALLLAKLDQLSGQITGMQTKLDSMQTQLDQAIQTAQQAREEAAMQSEPAYIPPQDDQHANTITLTRHDLMPETNEEALITNTASLVSQAENLVAAANNPSEQPMDMLGAVDLGTTPADTEVVLGSNAGEEVVVNSAMDSLYNARLMEQSQEEKESTFQDLLTPAQARDLAAQAQALKEKTNTLDQALKATEDASAAQNEEKEALLNELTAQQPQENVLDQVIKEREAEKAATQHPAPAEAPASLGEEKQAEPANLQPLDFTEEAPALTIAPDAKNPAVQEEVLPADQMPADQVKEEEESKGEQTEKDPNNAARTGMMMDIAKQAGANSPDMPSLEDAGKPVEQPETEGEKDQTLQELVPGASSETPENVLITAEDLKDAFTEHEAQTDQTVEEMFGIGQTAAQTQAPVQTAPEDQAIPSLDAIGQQTSDQPLPVGNPNDLTEIELKEGSTYLISDFVPPAQANGNELPKELTGLKTGIGAPKGQDDQVELTEMVSSTNQTEKPLSNAENVPEDVTVSQVIVENTIKTKRGATLDIKTVPMVPEPAQTDRLQVEGLDDDINAQHDMKAADEKPDGKTKMILGVLVAIVLAALIYGMLAFMNLIPAQFNVFSSDKAQQAQLAEQNARMNEMLTEDQPVNYELPAQPAAQQPAMNPMDAVLEEVKNHPLMNGFTLKEFIEAKHPAAQNLITWDISTAVDPDNYSVLVKVPPENPQSFKISYRFNYNTISKELNPTISDAKNLLDQANQGMGPQQTQQPLAPAM